MRYVFGDSYGDLGNRELATDAASDNRYFQSLAAQRAADAAAAQQAQFGQQYQLSLADLGQRRADTQYNQQLQLAKYLQDVNQFGQTLDWHKANSALEARKVALGERQFDFKKLEPTSAEVYTKERDEQLKAQDANLAQLSKNAADTRNLIDAATGASTALPTVAGQADAVNKATTMPWWAAPAAIPFGVGGPAAGLYARSKRGQAAQDASVREVASAAPNDQPFDFRGLDFGGARTMVSKALTDRLGTLQADLANYDKQGITGYIARDPQSGKWVSTYRPRFNFGTAGGTRMVVPPNRSILRFDPMTGAMRPAEPVDVGAGE